MRGGARPGRFTETNTRLLAAAIPGLTLAAIAMVAEVAGPVPGAIALVGGVVLLLGHTLQVTVEEESLEVWLGLGLLRTRIRLADVVAVTTAEVSTAPWLGRGVRGSELVYAVGPRPAVRLELSDGRVLTVGLRDAHDLLAHLRRERPQ